MAENDRAFVWSVSPYVSGGVAGVTDSYYSSIRYAGPIAGVGADASARKDNLHLFGQLFCSYAWLSSRYSRNAACCTPCKVNIGCDYRIYIGNRLSVSTGGGVGLMGYLYNSLLLGKSSLSYGLNVNAHCAVDLMLSGNWHLFAEDTLPFLSWISHPNTFFYETVPSLFWRDMSFKAFAGNELKAGTRLLLKNGNELAIFLRHSIYTSGNACQYMLDMQGLDLGVAYTFTFKKRQQP